MRLLIDTNVILDVLLNRAEFGATAAKVLELAETDSALEFVSASAITDIYYVIKRGLQTSDTQQESTSFQAQRIVGKLREVVTILPVTDADIDYALALRWKDFEDAVQYAVALANDIDYIITRNADDFELKYIPSVSPKEFLAIYAEKTAQLS